MNLRLKMKNKITLIGINFYPEDTAIGLYSTQMCEYLSQNGYEVDVITGFPYYPKWEIKESYQDKPKFLKEQKENINIYRYKQYVPKNPSFKNRIIHLLDFTFGSFVNLFKIKKSGLVICIIPFTTSVFLGLVLAKLRGAKVWTHIQDFEFDAAIESGLAGDKKGLKSKIFDVLFKIEKKLLDKSDIVSTISYGMINKVESKTSTTNYFFPNWVDENFINPAIASQHEYLRSNKFKILYSGNIGAKQDWDFFLEIMEHFKDDDSIEFIIVGAGAKKEWLVGNTKKYSNITHYDPIEYEKLPDLLCSADLHILFQKNDVVDTVMPSKLLGMMASAKPSLVTGNLESEVAKAFEISKGGYFFDSDNNLSCFNIIEKLKNDIILSQEIGENARKYISENFSSKKVLANFETKIKEIINGSNN
jgi:colanic acid biosynthesis glycosyl transferase WcaI